MSKQNVYLGKVQSLSPTGDTLAAQPPPPLANVVTVNFDDGRTGLLDISYPLAAVWAKMIDYLRSQNRPVYVEVDPETQIIIRLYVPEAARVMKMKAAGEAMYVAFYTSSARYYLRSDHPGYSRMLGDLQAAMADKTTLLVTAATPDYEIIDVRPLPDSFGVDEPPGPPVEPIPDPSVSWARAVELFNLMNAESCNPCHSVGTDCISFKHPNNGCQIRAHLMCYMMRDMGETPEKIWLDGWLDVPTANSHQCSVSWGWHVAPTLMVQQPPGADVKMVIDPSLFTEPVTVDAWKAAQGDPNADLNSSYWDQYNPPDSWIGYDPNHPDSTASRETANNHMNGYRQQLDADCAMYGPPPYACPIDRKCFFIVDRSTFSNDEIDAMLHVGSPAVIEAAFFIVADGFTPSGLGITGGDLAGVPGIKPNLTFPAVAQMAIDVMTVSLEDPAHLLRRQRITWKYKITFTGSTGFVGEQQIVALSAEVNSETGTAQIYLIRQPNPYEIDGETCWLSTDLRVFQINAGGSRFGETIHANASGFIQNVLERLNNGTSGADTFEGISTDQQTSRLELSQSVEIGGVLTRVYNFAIAKVRYRALANPANNVRVFFRLFPASSTSLEYNETSTYRRIVHNGVTKPLLGVINNEVISIPCFAEPRVDTGVSSMTGQLDETNVKDISANPAGHEVVMYFGCWLDFNQEQARFPLYPGLNNGPYAAADMESIQRHIRDEHQCLVAEIAFDPAPIPANATPALSDKLAQRNLAIVESANPGQLASHRIAHTFEIRPTRMQLLPGEPVDELMIDWGNVPDGSIGHLYLPGADTGDILNLARKMWRGDALTRVNAHILQLRAGGIVYIPIPQAQGSNYAGMLWVDLPETVKKGQVFTMVARQVTGGARRTVVTHGDAAASSVLVRERRILGAFQITMPVSVKEEMLEHEARLLSNLRWIGLAIPVFSRWHPVFNRYVGYVADRVDALGGDASLVSASPSGDWRRVNALCRFLGLMMVVLIAAFFLGMAFLPFPFMAVVLIGVLAMLAWGIRIGLKHCRPGICKGLKMVMYGAGLAVAALALTAMLGYSTPKLVAALLAGAAAALGAGVMAWLRRCF